MSHIARRARPRRDQSGTALLEFALVAPIFFFVLYALVVFGMALALKQSVTNAASEGARSTIGVVDDPATPVDERVQSATNAVLGRMGMLSASQKASLTITPTIATCVSGTGTCITVKVSYPYDANPLVPSAPIIKQIQPKTIGATAVVRLS